MTVKWINGLVFGVQHQYYYDFDEVESDNMSEKLEKAPKVPMVIIYFGPLQIYITW
jgi:hypothetical protein